MVKRTPRISQRESEMSHRRDAYPDYTGSPFRDSSSRIWKEATGYLIDFYRFSEFLAANPEVLGSIPGATRFSE
jgi:hypothetical protein